jgi:hypothetical protein
VKKVKFVIQESSVLEGEVTLRLWDGGNIREALKAAGFAVGEKAVLILESDFLGLVLSWTLRSG